MKFIKDFYLSIQDSLKAGSLYRIFRSVIAAGRGVQKNRQGPAEAPQIYAVFGDPIGHSLSPVMHNSALAQAGLDGCYLAFRVKDIAAAVSGIRGLGIRGASITIPHKISVMNYLDQVDSLAADIGAVNTVVNRQGVLHGYNSDCAGAIKALREKTVISGKDVAVVGAGGGSPGRWIRHQARRRPAHHHQPLPGKWRKARLSPGLRIQTAFRNKTAALSYHY